MKMVLNNNRSVFNFLCRISILLYASVKWTMANNKDVNELSHLTEWQLNYLAQNVCSDLSLDFNFIGIACQSNFWKTISNVSSKPSTIQEIKCQTNTIIKFQLNASKAMQLFLLLPEKYESIEPVNYTLLQPKTTYGELNRPPSGNYTIWSTIITKDGTPYKWRRDLPAPQCNKDYKIRVHFKDYNNNTKRLNAKVEWDLIDDDDLCFTIKNVCNNQSANQYDVNNSGYINDDEEVCTFPTMNPRITLKHLHTDVDCEIIVKGMFGATRYQYQTPSCDEYSSNCMLLNAKPEIPENVKLNAYEYAVGFWEVRVAWSKPKVIPSRYNVTLRTDTIRTLVLSGNTTEAVFRNVIGKSFYNVSIYAIIGKKYAHTAKRSFFARNHVWVWIGAAGGAWSALALAVLGTLLCSRYHRSRQQNSASDQTQSPGLPPSPTSLIEDAENICMDPWTDHWEIRSDSLLFHEIIGEGAFGVVKRGTLVPFGKEVAVKMLKEYPTLEELRSFRSEIELMKSVGVHDHVVSLTGCCTRRKPFIVVEYCSKGDLLNFLRCSWDAKVKQTLKNFHTEINISHYEDMLKRNLQKDSPCFINKLYEIQGFTGTEFSSKDLLSFCRQIAMGMQFLAANRVVHRDLAARNIMVTNEKKLKIGDFGLSRDIYEQNQYKQKFGGKLPLKWMAIESLTRKIYTSQSDVWSFGIVMWEIVTIGGSPYPDIQAPRLVKLLRDGYRMPRPLNCNKELYEVMMSCWETQPRDRPTFTDLYDKLDEMLSSAAANEYISLETNDDVPEQKFNNNYIKMLIKGKFPWRRSNNYERTLKATPNYYISPPALVPQMQS